MKTKTVAKATATALAPCAPAQGTGALPTPVKTEPAHLELKRILVPVNFSESSLWALDYAQAFAESFRARIILLYVAEPAFGAGPFGGELPTLAAGNQNLLEINQERLRSVARKSLSHRLPVEVLVRSGRAASEIPDTAEALGVDLIVLGSREHSRESALDSTSERIVRHAPCAVLIVHSPMPPPHSLTTPGPESGAATGSNPPA